MAASSEGKDYYTTLGVLPDAEDVVIRAAYRALAQRYHPDRFSGSAEEANARMSEMNEAYAILSDPAKRKAYDETRGAAKSGGGAFRDAEEASPPGTDPLAGDWTVALTYYPDLSNFEGRLSKLAWKLANTFRAYLLDSRDFENRGTITERMEQQFYESYFGANPQILRFARRLIESSERKAALALNEAVRVLGDNAAPERIIPRIVDQFGLKKLFVDQDQIKQLLLEIDAFPYDPNLYVRLLKCVGGRIERVEKGWFSHCWRVMFEGNWHAIKDDRQFVDWCRSHVLPIAKSYVAP